ncbi:MAG: hypothetical protein ACJ8AO_18845 [Gemmatimonadaceae bacterium]
MPILPLHGHDPLRERLAALADAGRLPASLLLSGPRGVGKQRLALWLGQRLLCAGGPPRPCDACQPCRYARALTHPDLHWYFPRPRLKDADAAPADAVQDNGEAAAERAAAGGVYAAPSGSDGIFVVTVRAIVQQACLAPAMARRKVFVVGDAERMVPQEGAEQAANAFLKLLEEPPADTTIVLTSSEPGALLPTVRSRVVSLRVPPLADDVVRRVLAEPAFAAALAGERGVPRAADERVRLAAGAPGTLLGSGERGAARESARRLLEAAQAGREQRMRAAFVQGSAGARGAFSDTLDELTVLLRDRARDAARRGDERAAVGASRAVARVERAKSLASGNVSPNLVAAELLRELAESL